MKLSVTVLLIVIIVITGCSKDPVSVQNPPATKYKMHILPDSLLGFIYKSYTFKARIDGVAVSDMRTTWDMGDGTVYNKLEVLIEHQYRKVGKYTVKALGYDYFRDTLIAQDSIPVIITEPTPYATLFPQSVDTIMAMNEDGTLKGWMSLYLKTPIPSDYLSCEFHIIGGGLDTIVYGNWTGFLFKFAGTYTIVGTAKKPNGNFYAADTSTIKISIPTITLQDLQNMKTITVKLCTDPQSPLKDSSGFASPLIIAMPFSTVAPMSSSWNGTHFTVTHDVFTQSTATDYAAGFESFDGQISNDLLTINNLKVTLNDSTAVTTSSRFSKNHIRYGYSLSHLKLYSVTANKIVYAVVNESQADFVTGMYFQYTSDVKDIYSGTCYLTSPPDVTIVVSSKDIHPNPPYALVIFSK